MYVESGIKEKITESEYEEEINILNDNLRKLYAIFTKHNILNEFTLYEDIEKKIDKFLSNIKAKDSIELKRQLRYCKNDLEEKLKRCKNNLEEREHIIRENEKIIGDLKLRLKKSQDFFKKMYK